LGSPRELDSLTEFAKVVGLMTQVRKETGAHNWVTCLTRQAETLDEVTLRYAVPTSVVRTPADYLRSFGGSAEYFAPNLLGIALPQLWDYFGFPVEEQHLSRVAAPELKIKIHKVLDGGTNSVGYFRTRDEKRSRFTRPNRVTEQVTGHHARSRVSCPVRTDQRRFIRKIGGREVSQEFYGLARSTRVPGSLANKVSFGVHRYRCHVKPDLRERDLASQFGTQNSGNTPNGLVVGLAAGQPPAHRYVVRTGLMADALRLSPDSGGQPFMTDTRLF
jgi:hypothetical protein